MSTENWHEERDRLLQLLEGIQSGDITHIDHELLRELQLVTPANVATLKARIAELNQRLGDKAGQSGIKSQDERNSDVGAPEEGRR